MFQIFQEKKQEEQHEKPAFNPSLANNSSIFNFDKPKEMKHQAQVPWVNTIQVGYDILRNPRYNKGLSFTYAERREMNLHGLLPPVYQDINIQAKQVMFNLDRIQDNLEKYVYFMNILDINEKLFYHVLINNLPKLMPIVYTPTVGLACQKFGHIFTRPRGMYITIRDHGRIYQMLKNWPYPDVRAICVTDGERILGLGDLGSCGMGIPLGKLALYTAIGGISPQYLLPIMLDVGTNNDDLRNNEFYIGIKEKRNKNSKYDELLDEFMKAITHRFGPTTLIQFEDFGNENSFRLLKKYQNNYCTFNDDIQGTAAVTLSGIITSLKVKDANIKKLSDHIYIIVGAGSAGIGIADLISYAIHKENGKNIEECRKRIWLVDSKGLIFKNRKSGGIRDEKIPYAHEWNGKELTNLDEIINTLKCTVLLGVCGQGGVFTKDICQSVFKYNNRPIIMPMSNPLDKSECTAEDAYKWTNNKCLFASGTTFQPFEIKDNDNNNNNNIKIYPSQCNNSYIFPGVALGIIACKCSRVTQEMFYIAAQTLSNLVDDKLMMNGMIYPPIEKIRDCGFAIGVAIAQYAYKINLAREVQPSSIEDLIKHCQFDHNHHYLYADPVYNNLEKEFEDCLHVSE